MAKQSNLKRNRNRRQNYAIARKKLATTKMVGEQERCQLQKSASWQGIEETKAAERYASNIL
jgi:hypothetical protein